DQIEYHPEPLSIHQLISKSVALIRGNAFNKNISIEVMATKDEAVLADETLTSTVLRNLLTNAIKFTNSNGKITITTKQKDSFLEISIKDTGVGIEKENLTKIFTVDSKFSSLGTNNETGTGLGLILCKEFVEMQGGKIYAESNLGIGSEFSFTLPLS
ncbi:MAG TPA: HAMP domain-containing sensor histidine kinase, partial [Leptospiraceae bacterium]|nr:HAMP domain-containing sensor histidine kinase [Leptospiraceae bacterium]